MDKFYTPGFILAPIPCNERADRFPLLRKNKHPHMNTILYPKTKNSIATLLARWLMVLAIVGITAFQANAQIPVTVTGTAVTSPALSASYTSLANALAALNAVTSYTTNGTIVFTCAGGNSEIAPPTGLVIGSATLNPLLSATNTVTIINSGGAVTVNAGVGTSTPGSAAPDGIISIRGADFITIDGLTLVDGNGANPATMEFGIGLFKLSATDGAQNNTVQNCNITLNRINNAGGTGPAMDGSVGIQAYNATATAATTALTITVASGTNSNNKFYTNTIQNCNIGIGLSGFASATLGDSGNDIGGVALATGNNILNFGGGGTTSPAAGIRLREQIGGCNVSFNTINNNNGAGVNHATTLRGIYGQTGTSASVNINNNTVTVKSGATTSALTAIENTIGATAAGNTVNINNNTITGCTYATATTGVFTAITNTAAATTVNISNNQITNNSTNPTSGAFAAISNTAAVGTLNITGNQVTNNTTSATSGAHVLILNSGAATVAINMNSNNINGFTFTAGTNSSALTCISSTAGAVGSTLTMNSNNIQAITYSGTGSGAHIYLRNAAASPNTNFNNNTFTNLNVNTTGSVTFIQNNVTHAANTVHFVNSNSIVTAFNKGGSGGNVIYYHAFGTSGTTVTETNTGNNFSNVTITGTTTMAGWLSADGAGAGGSKKIITGNTFSNIIAGTGAITSIMYVGFSDPTFAGNNISGNTISNVTSAGTVVGFFSDGQNQNFFNNTITGITTTGTSVAAISYTGATVQNCFKNRICNIEANNAAGSVTGILITAGTTFNIYNNRIGDLRTPSTATATFNLIGIASTSTTAASNINVYYNTINLSGSSTGSPFNSACIFHTTNATATIAALDMRNNILVNSSIPSAAGVVAAYVRSNTVFTNYAATSNRNLFYAGTPGAQNLIYFDGTNSSQTLGAYQALAAPRDANSVTELPTYLSTSCNNADFLKLNPVIATQAESGGTNVTSPITITDDFENDIRHGNVGYSGSGTAPDIGADEFEQVLSACVTANGGTATLVGSPTICGSGSRTITDAGFSTGTGSTYEWEQSNDNFVSNIVGTGIFTPGTFSTGTITSTTYYRLRVQCSTNSSTAYSNIITISVFTPPVITVSPTSGTFCNPGGAAVVLTASNGVSYTWAPAAGLSATTGASVNASPSANTTYTVTGTDANGCTGTATAVITVASTPTTPVITPPAPVICAGASVSISASSSIMAPVSNTLGTGSSTTTLSSTSNTNFPNVFEHFFGGNKNQMLILASELTGLGMVNGSVISSIGFTVASVNRTDVLSSFEVKMGNTAATSITTFQSGLTVARTAANYTTNVSPGLNVITLDFPFVWNGSSNVIIETSYSNNDSPTSGNVTMTFGTTAFSSTVIFRADNTAAATMNAYVGAPTFTYSSRPNITFGYTAPVPLSGSAFSWAPGSGLSATTGSPVSASPSGTTTYTVTAANGACTATSSVTVTVNTPPSLSETHVNVNCFGNSTGSVDLSVTGNGPFSYDWVTNAVTCLTAANCSFMGPGAFCAASACHGINEDLTGIPAGNYTVTVTDANGCTATLAVTVTQPAALVATCSGSNIACAGDSTGTASVVASGGTSPYSYSWATPGSVTLTSSKDNTIYQQNQNNSSGVGEFMFAGELNNTFINRALLQFNLSSIPAGAIITGATLTLNCSNANGASGPQQMNLHKVLQNWGEGTSNGGSGGVGVAATTNDATWINRFHPSTPWTALGGDFSGTVSGSSVVNLPAFYNWSSAGMVADLQAWLNNPSTNFGWMLKGLESAPLQAKRFDTRENVVAANRPSLTITYVIPFGTTSTITGLGAGTYCATVTDANGCTASCCYTVTAAVAMSLTEEHVNVLCSGEGTGSINITVTGGTSPFTYSWDDGTTTEDRTGLNGGTYTIFVTDSCGATVSTSVTITEPANPLSVSASITDLQCNGDGDGEIDITASDGTPPYTYLWDNGSTNEDRTGLSGGIYTVTVTDANGCTTSATYPVNEPSIVTAPAVITNVSCFGGNNGSINITPDGGTPGYTFEWDDSDTNEDHSGLTAGTYTVTVTDAILCAYTFTYTVTQPAQLVATETHTNVVCAGGNNGTIDVTVTGGTVPYTYSWTDAVTTEDRTGLSGGTYTVYVIDANGCTASVSATITEPAALTVTTTVNNNVNCFGGNDGSATAIPSGGTSPYSYLWDNGQTTATATGLMAGTYTVTVTDFCALTATATAEITEPVDPIQITASITDNQCTGETFGEIDIDVSGGTSPYAYLWSNGSTNEDLINLAGGTYTVTVTDDNGCTASASFTVNEPSAILITGVVTPVSCFGGNNGAINVTVSGGTPDPNGPPDYSYQWSNAETTEDLSGLSPGTYTVIVTDFNFCTASQTFTVTQPAAPLTATCVTDSNLTCNGAFNGQATVTPAGGTSPYTYLWSNAQTTATATGLGGGTYTVTVTDANGCTATCAATISEPPALTVSITVNNNVNCNGGNDGSATAVPSGGTSPYSYLWDNGQTTATATGLMAGIYQVTVTDFCGSTATATAEIIEPQDPIQITASITDNQCSGETFGEIDIDVSGGSSPYTYLWSNGSTNQDLINLAGGTYTITVTDDNGCTASASFTVNEPSAILITGVVTPVSCFGGNNGAINVTVSGGTPDPNGPPDYSYQWSNAETTEDLLGLSPGTYTVIVTDFNFCTASQTFTVTQPAAPLTATCVTDSNLTCNGAFNGQATVTPAGGTSPYTYLWSNAQTTATATGLGGGTYTVTVTDANGCTATCAATISEPPALTVSITVNSNVNCNGGNDGSATAVPSGGTSPYSYLWDNSQTTATATGLIAGIYQVTVTDFCGSTATATVEITEPLDPLQVVASITDNQCNGETSGEIDIDVIGGTPPYVYLWSNASTNQDLINLAGGTYTVTVTDDNGCTTTASYTVNEPSAVAITGIITPVSCFGGLNGAINISVSGGTPDPGGPPFYSYQWSNFETTEDISGLAAGTYTVIVSDFNFCSATASFTVTEPTQLVANCAVVNNAGCNGGSNGQASVTPSGGTPAYSFLWSNGQTTSGATGLAAGTYTVTVTDANLCTATCSVTISEPAAITVSELHTNVSCNGGSDGSINITASGGTPPYTYLWNNGNTNEDRTGLSAGTYTVTVSDANGCSGTTSVTITEPAVLTATETHTNASCNGGSDGTIDVTVSGGTVPYTYSWNNGTTTEDRTGLSAGTYTVYVNDANGCTTSVSATITEPTQITITETHTDATCNGGSDGTINITVSGGTPAYTYSWNNGNTNEDRSGLSAGTYTIYVNDANGCTASLPVTVGQPDSLTVTITTNNNVSCFGGNNGQATAVPANGTGPYSFLWSNAQTTATATGLAAGIYTVTVTDSCNATATAEIEITEPLDPVEIQSGIINLQCNGDTDGEINISVTGGTPGYTYTWSTGSTNEDLTGLAAGTYTVTVTDALGCTATGSFEITEPTAVAVTGVVTPVSCFGGSDGSVNITVTGGTPDPGGPPDYTFDWSNGATTEDISGLIAGTYTVTVYDFNFCSNTQTFVVTQPTAVTASCSIVSNVLCNGQSNGSATVTPGGGTPGYTFLWSNGQTTATATGLAAGTYTVTVTDANLCTATCAQTITEPLVLTATELHENISCNGGNDGSIDITVSGGTSQYLFLEQWQHY